MPAFEIFQYRNTNLNVITALAALWFLRSFEFERLKPKAEQKKSVGWHSYKLLSKRKTTEGGAMESPPSPAQLDEFISQQTKRYFLAYLLDEKIDDDEESHDNSSDADDDDTGGRLAFLAFASCSTYV